MTKFNSEQLQAINSNADRILCLAGAGAGKTAVLIARLSRLVNDGVNPSSILALTFTNAAAAEMKSRYEKQHIDEEIPEFRTFHAFCYSLLCKDPMIRTALGYDNVPGIASDAQEKEIEEKAKTQCKITISKDKLKNRTGLTKQEQFQVDLYDKAVTRLMRSSNLITFDRLNSEVSNLFEVDHPATKAYKEKYKYICQDEMQDADPIQMRFLNSFPNSNFYFCGDALQCQPAGTMVTMSDLTVKPIEDLKVGDHVLSYNVREGRYLKYSNRTGDFNTRDITAISTHIANNVVKVSTANYSSRYTKDHITYAKIHYVGNEDSFVTYLMANDDGWWRVGSTKLFLGSQHDGFGPHMRMKQEQGSKVWILGVYKSAEDAWLSEQLTAYKFGIPQTTWVLANVSRYTIESLAALYHEISDIQARADACLSAFGRDINYPLFTKDDLWNHFSKLHLFECRVGNLIPGVFDIVIPQKVPNASGYMELRNTYEVIESITEEPEQVVYGLNISLHHNYVGDGILTHNCIYSFRGTSNAYIKALSASDGWDKIRLFSNYRSTNQICEYANRFSAKYADASCRIEMRGTRDGDKVITKMTDGPAKYSYMSNNDLEDVLKELNKLTGTSAILCRTNKEVAAVAAFLKSKDIEFTSNHDNDLPTLVDCALSDNFAIGYLASLLSSDKYGDYIRLSAQVKHPTLDWFVDTFGGNSQIKPIAKKISFLRTVSLNSENTNTKLDMVAKEFHLTSFEPTDKQFSDKKFLLYLRESVATTKSTELYVGTIHSVKGLEYDNVFVMNVGSYNFRLNNEDMKNLFYVAVTRAKNRLYIYELFD